MRNDVKRYKGGIECDRGEYVRVTDELMGVEDEDRRELREFVRAMEENNNELHHLLVGRENEGLRQLVTGETMGYVVERAVGEVQKLMELNHRGVTSSSGEGGEDDYATVQREHWNAVTANIEEEAERMNVETGILEENGRKKMELEKLVKSLREKFMGANSVSLLTGVLSVIECHLLCLVYHNVILTFSPFRPSSHTHVLQCQCQ